MKKKLSELAFISAVFLIVVIVLSVSLSGCEKALDEVVESYEMVPDTKSGTVSDSAPSDSTQVDTVSVSDWESVSAGSVVFQ